MTVEAVVENIQKELEEAKRYKYPEFIVKQDLIRIIEEFENQIIEYIYDSAREDIKAEWERSHEDLEDEEC